MTDDDDTAHFQSIPWVSRLLTDPSFITTPIPSRIFKSSSEDSLFSTTINTPSTIAKCLTQYRRPQAETNSNSKPFSPEAIPTNELRIFCTLGSDLNGYPGVLHGGMVATLLDECTGLILSLSLGGGMPGMKGPVTAYLNTKFKRPVLTPGTVVVSARIVEAKENRKWRLVGDIRDEGGNVLSEAEGLYILPRGAGTKL